MLKQVFKNSAPQKVNPEEKKPANKLIKQIEEEKDEVEDEEFGDSE